VGSTCQTPTPESKPILLVPSATPKLANLGIRKIQNSQESPGFQGVRVVERVRASLTKEAK